MVKSNKQTLIFKNKPQILSGYSIVGPKEGDGFFGKYFDEVISNDLFEEKSYEMAERKLLSKTITGAIKKVDITSDDIDILISGDLLNQITSSSYSARELNCGFMGIYGACSTMALSLTIGAMLIDGNFADIVGCATCSHFSSSEKQYRYPLELGNQRPPMAQWTVTGAGCTLLSKNGSGIIISMATIGKVEDYGICDANDMGAAMAPAVYSTLMTHFKNTNTTPNDYDAIFTGDLGKFGSDILRDLMEKTPYKLDERYSDCGHMMYKHSQHTFQGGSGAGCSASVLNGFILKQLELGILKKVLFIATGALLSPTMTFEGESIPSVAHAVVIEKGE